MDASSLLAALRLRGSVRGGSSVVTVGAANLNTGLDTAIQHTIWPDTGLTRDEIIIVESITEQGVAPAYLTLQVRDMNRPQATRVLFDATQVCSELLIGDMTRGVQLVIRNAAGGPATVAIMFSVVERAAALKLLGELAAV